MGTQEILMCDALNGTLFLLVFFIDLPAYHNGRHSQRLKGRHSRDTAVQCFEQRIVFIGLLHWTPFSFVCVFFFSFTSFFPFNISANLRDTHARYKSVHKQAEELDFDEEHQSKCHCEEMEMEWRNEEMRLILIKNVTASDANEKIKSKKDGMRLVWLWSWHIVASEDEKEWG